MHPEEERKLRDYISSSGQNPGGMPMKGWVIEIRGYTYHKDAIRFVTNTFVENLARFGEGKSLVKKVEDKKITFIKLGTPTKKLVTLPVTDDVKVMKGNYNETSKRVEFKALEEGLDNKLFKRSNLIVELVIDDENKPEAERKITEVRYTVERPFQQGSPETLAEIMADRIDIRTSMMIVYKMEEGIVPKPGVFEVIYKSYLPELVKEPPPATAVAPIPGVGAPPPPPPGAKGPPGVPDKAPPAAPPKDRGKWVPLGTGATGAAPAAPPPTAPPAGGAPTEPPPQPAGETVKRTEFVILFIWMEPFLNSEMIYGPLFVEPQPSPAGQPPPSGQPPPPGQPPGAQKK
jgi:hypothetical protein